MIDMLVAFGFLAAVVAGIWTIETVGWLYRKFLSSK